MAAKNTATLAGEDGLQFEASKATNRNKKVGGGFCSCQGEEADLDYPVISNRSHKFIWLALVKQLAKAVQRRCGVADLRRPAVWAGTGKNPGMRNGIFLPP